MPEKFIAAREWGANPSKDATEDSHPIGRTEGVSVHWVGPGMGRPDHDECAGHVRAIERHHEYGRGWGDIAYNALVCPHGWIHEGRGAGVRPAANGDRESNENWYAVCYLGGEGDGFTDAGKAGVVRAVQWLRDAGRAGPRVNGHRDHKATSCPGDQIYRWLQNADFTTAPDDGRIIMNADDRDQIRQIIREELTRPRVSYLSDGKRKRTDLFAAAGLILDRNYHQAPRLMDRLRRIGRLLRAREGQGNDL